MQKEGDKKMEGNVLFGEVLKNWLTYKKSVLKDSSYNKYYRMIYLHFIPEIGDIELCKMNSGFVSEYLSQKKREGSLSGKELSDSFFQTLVYILKNSAQYAVNEEIIEKIPFHLPPHPNKIRNHVFMEEEQQKKLKKVLLHEINSSKLGVLLTLYTGLRIGELCALRWNDIYMEESFLIISKTVQRLEKENFASSMGKKTELLITSPKSSTSVRKIPIPSKLLPLLKMVYQKENKKPEFYLVSRTSGKMIEPRTYEEHFKRYLKEAGLPNLHFHVLRHTFATNCVNCGVDPKTLSELLGHSSVNITLQRYVHSSFKRKQMQMELLFNDSGEIDISD